MIHSPPPRRTAAHPHRPARITVSAKRFHAFKLQNKGTTENWQALAKAWIATERPDPAHSSNIYTPIQPKPSPPSDPPASPAEVQSAISRFREAIQPENVRKKPDKP